MIGYRKLHLNLTDRQLEDFDAFRRKAMNCDYSLSLNKILFRPTSEHPAHSQQGNIDPERSFFCSELAVKCFKVLGLMKDNQKSCTLYYPKQFEDGEQVDQDLKPGIFLGQTYNVLVDRDNDPDCFDDHD